jgi:hypothetical protein
MPKPLFARLDRIWKHVDLRSRGELLALCITIMLDMCEDHTKRYLPSIVALYDERRPLKEDPRIANLSGTQHCGTHFDRTLEERIAAVVRPIRWSRNQFITEAANTMVSWFEYPSMRTIPLVALLYDTGISEAVQVKLKRKP